MIRSVISNEIPDGFEFISENDSLALYAEFDSGKIAVHVKKAAITGFLIRLTQNMKTLPAVSLKKDLIHSL